MTRSQAASSLLVVVLLVFQAMLATAVASPDMGAQLGLTPQIAAWMAIANVGVGVLLNQLRSLGSGTRDGDRNGGA